MTRSIWRVRRELRPWMDQEKCGTCACRFLFDNCHADCEVREEYREALGLLFTPAAKELRRERVTGQLNNATL